MLEGMKHKYIETIFMWVVYTKRGCGWKGRVFFADSNARWFFCRIVFEAKWDKGAGAPVRLNAPGFGMDQECGVAATASDLV